MTATAGRWPRIALAALLALSACGLSENAEPEAISPDNVPGDLLDPNPPTSTTEPASPDTTPVTVWFLEERSGELPVLIPVEREVPDPTRPGDRIEALLNQPPTEGEQDDGISTFIPTGVRLLDAVFDPDRQLLVINLSEQIYDIEGQGLSTAFAQMVWTAAEVDGVRQVRFRVDGEDIQALDAAGSEQSIVNTGDYRSLAPPP